MSLSSMTGFARAEGEHQGLEWHWELRSVNGKGLDLRLRLPPGFDALEPLLRERAQKALKRGTIQAFLQIDRREAASQVKLNAGVLDEVLRLAEDLRQRLGAPPPTIEGLLQVRGVLELSEPEAEGAIEAERLAALVASFEVGVSRLIAARREEGARLAGIIGSQLNTIAELTVEARDNPARAPEAIRARLAAHAAGVSRGRRAATTATSPARHTEAEDE